MKGYLMMIRIIALNKKWLRFALDESKHCWGPPFFGGVVELITTWSKHELGEA
jgi:hypothetical protein